MKKGMISKIKAYFSQKPSVVAVYLYGSQAKELAKNGSDIDLGIVVKKSEKIKPFFLPQVSFSQELTKKLGKTVEVQNLNNCRLDFAHRVITEGKLVYAGDEKKRIEFEEGVLRKYFDLKPFFDEYYQHLSEIAKRGEINVRYA